jgi:tetratricopeptide (TPR) repeat protein
MTRPGAAGTRSCEALLERERELRKRRELLAGSAASEAEVALRHAGMFEPGGALLFAHPIARVTNYDERPLAKRSREPRAARTLLDNLRLAGFAASIAIQCARIDLLTGDLATAEEELRRAWDASASIGEKYLLPPLAALLAEVVSAQGRLDEAEEFRRAAEELAASDDVELQALWPSLRGEVLAWQERAHVAECRAREALDLIRIRAALSRLTAAYSQNTSTDSDRSASDRRAWNAGGRAAHPITEKLDEHAEHIVEVFLNAIEAEKLYIDNEGGVHLAPTHGVRLHAAIAAIEQAYSRPPQAPARRADR